MHKCFDVNHENESVSLQELEGYGELTSFQSSWSIYKHWCTHINLGPEEQACQALQTRVFSLSQTCTVLSSWVLFWQSLHQQ